jgi:polyisoprenoid-binding protein YceI
VIHAQEKIFVEKGKIDFISNAPLEIIKASSSQIHGVIDPFTNQFAFTVDIQSFKGFNGGFQQEHFNEKYMESEKYPTASFQGKIIEQVDFSADGTYEVRAKGDLKIHGQKQTRIIKCKIIITNKVVSIEADFIVPLTDHNITIPRIISQKIATEIEVRINASTN